MRRRVGLADLLFEPFLGVPWSLVFVRLVFFEETLACLVVFLRDTVFPAALGVEDFLLGGAVFALGPRRVAGLAVFFAVAFRGIFVEPFLEPAVSEVDADGDLLGRVAGLFLGTVLPVATGTLSASSKRYFTSEGVSLR